jgi:glycosyltransferase involved in cell wall biosynthesis
MLREVRLDPTRTHFLARVPYETYVRALQLSMAHVYLSYPFVLSWSMLEAMACGALVVGSDTAPVREVIRHGENGMLVPFFDVSGLVGALREALDEPAAFVRQRECGRSDMANYSRRLGIAGYDTLIETSSPSSSSETQSKDDGDGPLARRPLSSRFGQPCRTREPEAVRRAERPLQKAAP